jgi:trans-aconitate 2-methyltransferase
MTDWDAERYHRLSDPQLEWGRGVLTRLAPRSGERILDLGCGTGRLTREVAATLGCGTVVGLDRSPAMLKQAAAAEPVASGPHALDGVPLSLAYVLGDGAHLPFNDAFDAVLSTATFHWIREHDALFSSIYRALSPGGRLVAQCGGGSNLARLLARAGQLTQEERFRSYFEDWADPWNFADVYSTTARLERAGFSRIDVWLSEAPTTLPDAATYKDFLSCVCVRHHVDRLPPDQRPTFLDALTEFASSDDPAFTLDYWRLNIRAVKPAGAEQAA